MNDEEREAGLTDRENEQAGVKAVDILANFEPGDRLQLGPGTTPEQLQKAWRHLGLKKAPVQLVDHLLEGTIVSAPKVKLTLKTDAAGRHTLSLEHDFFDAAGRHVGGTERTFDLTDRWVQHDAFILEDDMQGKRIASHVIPRSILAWQAAGLTPIKVRAGLDDGGAVWPKFGFVPYPDSWAELQGVLTARAQALHRTGKMDDEDLQEMTLLIGQKDSKTIGIIADSPFGGDLLRGTRWNGILDVDEFNKYLKKRGKL